MLLFMLYLYYFNIMSLINIVFISREKEEDEELDLTGIDDDEIDSYIMSGDEIRLKTKLWLKDR